MHPVDYLSAATWNTGGESLANYTGEESLIPLSASLMSPASTFIEVSPEGLEQRTLWNCWSLTYWWKLIVKWPCLEFLWFLVSLRGNCVERTPWGIAWWRKASCLSWLTLHTTMAHQWCSRQVEKKEERGRPPANLELSRRGVTLVPTSFKSVFFLSWIFWIVLFLSCPRFWNRLRKQADLNYTSGTKTRFNVCRTVCVERASKCKAHTKYPKEWGRTNPQVVFSQCVCWKQGTG